MVATTIRTSETDLAATTLCAKERRERGSSREERGCHRRRSREQSRRSTGIRGAEEKKEEKAIEVTRKELREGESRAKGVRGQTDSA